MLGKELLDVLCCPVCRGDLFYAKEMSELHCKKCRLAYSVKDDIAVMLVEEARRLDDSK
ncbi:MAG TPA: Trm112 family protein [Candidatus Wallbacteria bacterium]|nr:Trm112 family protein [Candidatus Wallbacteria bacterium]